MRYAVVVLSTLFHIALSPLQAQAPWLILTAEGVSPGAITAPPIEIDLGGQLGFVVTTEDRTMRFIEPIFGSEVVASVGFHARAAAYRADPATFILIGERLEMSRVDLGSGRGVRVRGRLDPRHGWTVVERAGFPGAILDARGNLYLLSGTTRIIHMSAAGTVLWARDLPTPPISYADAGGVLYLALQNGLVMRFDENGSGRSVLRLRSEPTSLAVDRWNGGGAILVAERSGGLSRYALGGAEPRELWTRRFDAPPRIVDVAGGTAFIAAGGRVYAVDRYGLDRWSIDASARSDGSICIIDDKRGAFLSDDGTLVGFSSENLLDPVGLDGEVTAIDALPRRGALLVRYGDWSWQVWTIEPRDERALAAAATRPSEEPPATTALGALVDLALESPTAGRGERAIAIVEERIDGAELYGDVTTARRLAVGLLTEVSRGGFDRPDIRLRAVRILARLLDDTSRAALVRAVRDDPEADVAAEAVSALARWGIEEEGVFAVVLARFRSEDDRGRRTLAEPIVRLLESLPALSDPDYTALAVAVAQADIDSELRRRAVEATRGGSE